MFQGFSRGKTSNVPRRLMGGSSLPILENREPTEVMAFPSQQATVVRSRAPIVEQFSQLPKALRIYGSDKKEHDTKERIKSSMGALVHDDNSVTILLTPEGENVPSIVNGFKSVLQQSFGKLNPSHTVSVAVLAQAYENYGKSAATVQVEAHSTNSQLKSFVFNVINEAMNEGASDIHIEVRLGDKPTAAIRYRVDGEMELKNEYHESGGFNLANDMAAILFQGDYADDSSRSNAQRNDKAFQHASIRIPELCNVALRYQTFLDKSGYDLVLRILTFDGKSRDMLDLDRMGFEPDQVEMLIKGVSAHYGASFLGGSTGSGKTTTMAGVMNADPYKLSRKRLTIEDPVEIELAHATQCSIQRAANDTSAEPFIAALKAVLRSDPDLVMIGEVRERATASLMVDAAIAGHNIWGTLHINRMFDALYRLTADSIGIHHTVLGSGNLLNLLNAQTLVRTLCPHCKIPVNDGVKRGLIQPTTLENLAMFGLQAANLFVANRNQASNSNACPHCKGKGESGRTVCAEMCLVDDEMKSHISKGEFDQAERVYRLKRTSGFAEDGMAGKTFLDHAMLKAARGLICANLVSDLTGNRLREEYAARQFHGYVKHD